MDSHLQLDIYMRGVHQIHFSHLHPRFGKLRTTLLALGNIEMVCFPRYHRQKDSSLRGKCMIYSVF